MSRVNNSEACISCSRRADGLAVGHPGKLGWYCKDCGSDLAKIALAMHTRDFDVVEKRAAEDVSAILDYTEPVVLTADEMPRFIRWAVTNFADKMRDAIASGAPPF